MLEQKWDAVSPQLLTANGTTTGQLQVADTAGFRIKQVAYLKDNSNTLPVQVKRVLSKTLLIVGAVDNKIASWIPIDLSAWTTANGAAIGAEQQPKNNIPDKDHYSAIYESDPVVADRVVQVDKYGNYYDIDNPMPIVFDGTVAIGDVVVKGTNGNSIEPNPDGSINVVISSAPASNTLTVSKYNEILAVPSGAITQLNTYTVPVGKQAVLQRCPVSGENIARYDLLINGVVQDTVRTMFGGDLTQMFDFTSGNDSGLVLNAGDTVKIQVRHDRPDPGAFEARIQVLEINL
jgi:hypothetical protein